MLRLCQALLSESTWYRRRSFYAVESSGMILCMFLMPVISTSSSMSSYCNWALEESKALTCKP